MIFTNVNPSENSTNANGDNFYIQNLRNVGRLYGPVQCLIVIPLSKQGRWLLTLLKKNLKENKEFDTLNNL